MMPINVCWAILLSDEMGFNALWIPDLLANLCPPALRAEIAFDTSSADRGVTMQAGRSLTTWLQYDSFREV